MATLVVVYLAFSSRCQFYPAMVYLSTSKISLVPLLNMGLVFMCMLWKLTKHLFLGSLREVEIERLNEQSWRELMETLFAITIFRYMILAITTVSTFVKYVFYVGDMFMEGQWERKLVYTFYLELIHDLLHLSMYLCFFSMIFAYYGLPLHLIRELYETVRNFKIRVADYIHYRKITSNMNDRFQDATTEEIDQSDCYMHYLS